MSILKKPYALYLQTENQAYTLIGQNDSADQGRAFGPKWVCNINGSHTLTFTVYYSYIDVVSGKNTSPNWITYLRNEAKVKLNYDGKDYEMIVKNIKKDNSKKTYEVTAVDAFINELSKNGFNFTFDPKINNNVGTVQTLAKRVLEDNTDWIIPDVNTDLTNTLNDPLAKSEFIADRFVEDLVCCQLKTSLNAYQIDDSTSMPIIGANTTINSGSIVYVFYSCLKDCSPVFQFIYRADNTFQLDEDSVITDANSQYLIEVDSSFYGSNSNEYGLAFPASMVLLGPYIYGDSYKRGKRYNFSPDIAYNSVLEQYVTTYTKSSIEYKGYKTTDYRSPILVQDYITNGENMIETSGWSVTKLRCAYKSNYQRGDLKINAKRIGTDSGGETHEYTVLDDLIASNIQSDNIDDYVYDTYLAYSKGKLNQIESNGSTETQSVYCDCLVNSGLFDNRVLIETLGEAEYRFEVKYKTSKNLRLCIASYPYSSVGMYYDTDPDQNPRTENTNIQPQDSPRNYIIGSDQGANQKYISLPASSGFNTVECIIKIKCPLSKKEYKNNKVQLFIYNIESTNNNDLGNLEIAYCRFYQAIKDNNNSWITPYSEKIEPTIIETYHLYKTTDLNKISNGDLLEDGHPYTLEDIPEIKVNHKDWNNPAKDTAYTTVRSLEKRRNITIKESNYFNIIQTLCETFQCWAYFYVGPKGKYIFFHNYIGQPNYAGFKYGVNLKSISRTDDSKQIVTKLIVKNNSNKFGKNGFCSIQRAGSNPTGENFILKFDYLLDHGLLDASEYLLDLYNLAPIAATQTTPAREGAEGPDGKWENNKFVPTAISIDNRDYTEIVIPDKPIPDNNIYPSPPTHAPVIGIPEPEDKGEGSLESGAWEFLTTIPDTLFEGTKEWDINFVNQVDSNIQYNKLIYGLSDKNNYPTITYSHIDNGNIIKTVVYGPDTAQWKNDGYRRIKIYGGSDINNQQLNFFLNYCTTVKTDVITEPPTDPPSLPPDD